MKLGSVRHARLDCDSTAQAKIKDVRAGGTGNISTSATFHLISRFRIGMHWLPACRPFLYGDDAIHAQRAALGDDLHTAQRKWKISLDVSRLP